METSEIKDIEVVENMLKIGNFIKMFRVNYMGYRLYIQQEPFEYFSGLTGALSAATFAGNPDHKRLVKWREKMVGSFGEKNTDDYVGMTADFGTLLHMALVTIKEKGGINWSEEKDMAYNYFVNAYKAKSLEPDLRVIKAMSYEYCKHVASLMQFIHERVHEIYAIETPAIWKTMKIATPIDLFCSCRCTEKGAFKNVTINLKTSNQISGHQMEQVACEQLMWNETYELQAENTAILRTKDWMDTKVPTFDFKYLSLGESTALCQNAANRLWICLNSDSSYYPSPTNKSFNGVTKVGEKPVIITKTLKEEWESILIL
jgi:hypothetical protein